ncbi:MAG TPA: hypothetical protein VHA13_02840 [Gammaproteobacteria bacterium]|nr:hypothetical protein [Gammaproteobacteria bacterium]
MQDFVCRLECCHQLTPQVAQIFLSNKAACLNYQAGQYIKVVHPDLSTSPLSIANAPKKESSCLEFHLYHPNENQRAISILNLLKENKQLILRGPFGSCTVNALAPNKPIIFLARGTGFAPIKAVIEELIQKPDYPAIHLYWSVAGWRDLYMHNLVEQWVRTLKDFHFTAVLSREVPTTVTVKSGKMPEVVLQDYPDLSVYQVYASGPEAMVYAALEGMQEHGLDRKYFYSDLFDYVP